MADVTAAILYRFLSYQSYALWITARQYIILLTVSDSPSIKTHLDARESSQLQRKKKSLSIPWKHKRSWRYHKNSSLHEISYAPAILSVFQAHGTLVLVLSMEAVKV